MRLLLDTHVFLWYISADPRLPSPVLDLLRDPGNEVYLSVASVWETVIKHALGKLPLPGPPAEFLPEQRLAHQIASLPVEEIALVHLAELPPHHRDPFDRLLMAQALAYQLTLVTLDEAMQAYAVPILPAA